LGRQGAESGMLCVCRRMITEGESVEGQSRFVDIQDRGPAAAELV